MLAIYFFLNGVVLVEANLCPGQSQYRDVGKPVWPFTRAFSRTVIKETNTQPLGP